jgi:putative cardiolipin synthase
MTLGLLASLTACGGLPPLDGRSVSSAPTDTEDTRLGHAIAPHAAQHPGLSGIRMLPDAHEAFAARMLLAALRAAAERGVRVRLLLDDNGIAGLDDTLAALNAHPNIEVRLFNPFVMRGSRALGYLTDFSRLNRRMHNKSFTADNQAAIVGGRNIGDEYFGAGDGTLFVDLDVIAVGPVVREASRDFDRYWASRSAYPLELIVAAVEPARQAELTARLAQAEREPASAAYVNAIRETRLVQQLVEGQLDLEWAATRMVSDDPAKGLGRVADGSAGLLQTQLEKVIGHPDAELALVSAYFVPTAAGTDAIAALARRGVKVSILTNALEATDVAPVHAGYAKRRKALLDAGVALWELRRTTPRPESRGGLGGSSASSLHAKTFVVDRSRIFVGSFNFDPRSLALNTELGFVINSPVLAGNAAAIFEQGLREHAYEVQLDEGGRLIWLEQRGSELLHHEVEPGTGFWQRAAVWFLSLLPIEWLF